MKTDIKQTMISVFDNSFDESDVKEVKKVLKSHLVGMGRVTEKFENEFKKRIGFKSASAVSSCSNGFWLVLRTLGFKPSDEIIIPNIHFFGIKNVMDLLNINYKITDVGKSIPNITLKEIIDNVTVNTKAIIFLEYGGYPILEIEEIKQYLKDNNREDICLILDAANSPFTKYRGKHNATNYDIAVYSFDMNKILVTGEGGMVLSNNEYIINKTKSLSYYGILDSKKTAFEKSKTDEKWWEIETTIPSLKLVMNNIAASLGLTQLNKIETILEKRTGVLQKYRKLLNSLALEGLLEFPQSPKDVENNVYLFWLVLKDEITRNNLAKFLLKNNIYTTVKYQPLDKNVKTPNAFSFYNRAIDLPLNQNITQKEQDYIIKTIYRFFSHGN
jgi:dTDP-4-amino-4,6-dideoxygalactose transaminase